MILLDSSVIIPLFRENEEYHFKAIDIWSKFSEFLILDQVLSEVLTVLKIREGHEIASRSADFLKNNKKITFRLINRLYT